MIIFTESKQNSNGNYSDSPNKETVTGGRTLTIMKAQGTASAQRRRRDASTVMVIAAMRRNR